MTSYLRKLCTCLFHLTILQRSNLYHEKIENAILIRQLLIRDDNCDYDVGPSELYYSFVLVYHSFAHDKNASYTMYSIFRQKRFSTSFRSRIM